MDLSNSLNAVLMVSITPYFLEKGNVWFEENLQQILEAQKTQQFFQENILFLKKNQTYPLSEMLRKLDELRYEKVFHITDPGEFSVRGGIIEIFPINLNNAVRIEFLGNMIESIETLDVIVENEEKTKEILKKRLKSQKLFADLKGLKEGDYLVHLDHGVGKFTGISYLVSGILYPDEQIQDTRYKLQNTKYYALEYASGDKLFIPAGLERKLSRYIGFQDPHISRLGSPFWTRTKRKIKEEVEKLAKEILDLYAKREIANRPPYHEQNEISQRVATTFLYQETPDQSQALEDIKKDLGKDRPMDRIVCGDVGFGKTEIALRAMVHAVENNYQAALLAPTTILAYQHFQTFKERLKNLPVRTALLSRLQSKKEQERILAEIKNGTIDIVIGTHRLLSNDVEYKNLGLLVIDDEQKFGVKQKEKLRELRSSLDVLSLSATPIPRTLYMALSSLKNISIIQTPPQGRFPIATNLSRWNKKTIKQAIEKELERNGQIYYLHNRIGTLEKVKQFLEKLIPGLRVCVAHGRLNETQLIKVMDDFTSKKYNILLATTIIENGIDNPNVNTLIVEDATRLGLGQAYQLRGRIGRSTTQAHAYFLYNSKSLVQGSTKLRLEALKEAQELGSGYRIAIKDLEIRGAGNILGKEQSGSVNAIGLNLYCQMLSESVEKIKGGQMRTI